MTHLIISDTGEVIEFCDPRIETIKKTIEEVLTLRLKTTHYISTEKKIK